MGEPYRTLLGHFPPRGRTLCLGPACARRGQARRVPRRLRQRQKSITGRRSSGTTRPVRRWIGRSNFVSAYATAHPWEDFAETWAHYLHIVDTMEMAKAYDVKLAPAVDRDGEFAVDYGIDPYHAPDVEALVKVWLPVSTALNSLNRTMGHDELYPFILSPGVIAKLGFIHGLVRGVVREPEPGSPGRLTPAAGQSAASPIIERRPLDRCLRASLDQAEVRSDLRRRGQAGQAGRTAPGGSVSSTGAPWPKPVKACIP